MTDVDTRIVCQWCQADNVGTRTTCDRCGAPLDVREAVTASGWHQAPRIRDLTEVHWSASTCQLDAGVVPVAEVDLDPGDTVFFEHHTMLWKDDSVPMSVMSTPGGAQRLLSGMPFVLSVARGPGRLAFSRDAPGELVVLPVDPGTELDVREHALLAATGTLTYSYERLGGIRAALLGGTGMYLDRYVAASGPGLLVVHGYGNVAQRSLAEGEVIQVEPGGFLYKDSSVDLEVENISLRAPAEDVAAAADPDSPAEEPEPSGGGRFGRGLRGLKAARAAVNVGALTQAASSLRSGGGIQGAAAGLLGGGGLSVFRLTGPGRVGIQSMYQNHHAG